MKPSLEHHQSIPYSKSEPDLVAKGRKFYKKYEDRSDLKWKPRGALAFSGRIESVPIPRAQLPILKKVQSVPHIPSLQIDFSPRKEREKRRTRSGRCSFGPDDNIPEHEEPSISQKSERQLELPPPEYLSSKDDLPLESTLGSISEKATDALDSDSEEEPSSSSSSSSSSSESTVPAVSKEKEKEGALKLDYDSFVVFSGVQNVRPGMQSAMDGDHSDRLKLCNGSDCYSSPENPCPFTHLSPTLPSSGSPSFSYTAKTPSPGLVGLLYQIDDYQGKRQRNLYSHDDSNGFIFNKHEQSLSPEPSVLRISGAKRHPLQSIHSVSSPSLTSLARAGGIDFPPKNNHHSKDDEILGRPSSSRGLSAAAPVFIPTKYEDRNIIRPSTSFIQVSNMHRCISAPHVPSLCLNIPNTSGSSTPPASSSSSSSPSSSSIKYSPFHKPYRPSRPSSALFPSLALSEFSVPLPEGSHPSLPSPGQAGPHQAFPTAVFTPIHGMVSGPVPPIGAPDPAPALPLVYKPPDSGPISGQEVSVPVLSAKHSLSSPASLGEISAGSFRPQSNLSEVSMPAPPLGDESPHSSPLSLPLAHSPPTGLILNSSHHPPQDGSSSASTESPKSDQGESRRKIPKRKKDKRLVGGVSPNGNNGNSHATPNSPTGYNANSHEKSPTTSLPFDLSAANVNKRSLLDCFQ